MRSFNTRAGALMVVGAMTLAACGDPQADPTPDDATPVAPFAAQVTEDATSHLQRFLAHELIEEQAAAGTARPVTGDASPVLLFIMEEGFQWDSDDPGETISNRGSLAHELEKEQTTDGDERTINPRPNAR